MTPDVHAKMMRLLSGQRSALRAVDRDTLPGDVRASIESAIESTDDQIAALGDNRGE